MTRDPKNDRAIEALENVLRFVELGKDSYSDRSWSAAFGVIERVLRKEIAALEGEKTSASSLQG